MSKSWRSLFTDVNELQEIEPETIEVTQLDGGGLDESHFESQGYCKGRDSMSLVENISQRYYGKSPVQMITQIGEGIETIHEVQIWIGRLTGFAKSGNVKDSTQLAAHYLLLDIIKNNENETLGLPFDKEEALKYVENIEDKAKGSNPKDNWPGKCSKLCSDKGFTDQPHYQSDSGVGPPHDREFTCTATFPNLNDVISKGATKKQAKSNAAQEIYYLIEKLPDGPNAGKKKGVDCETNEPLNNIGETSTFNQPNDIQAVNPSNETSTSNQLNANEIVAANPSNEIIIQ